MADTAICAGCSRPMGSGGLILVSAAPLPLHSGGKPARSRALRAVVIDRDTIPEALENVYCGKACALARLSDELDAVLGIERASHLASPWRELAEAEAEGGGCAIYVPRVRHIPCAYAPKGCPSAYRRRMRWEGADCMEVLTCGETHTAVTELAECPAAARLGIATCPAAASINSTDDEARKDLGGEGGE